MTDSFLQILQQHPEISSNPQLIKTLPVHLSSRIVEVTKNIVTNLKDQQQLKIVVEALSIHNKFKNNKILFNEHKDKILSNHAFWVTQNELKNIEDKFFNTNKNIDHSTITELIIFEEIERIRKEELEFLINKGQITFNLNNDFCQKNMQLSTYLKKIALDKMSLDTLGKANSNFIQLFSLKRYEKKNNNENFISPILSDSEVIFSYINMNKMDIPKIPRFGSVFDSYHISNHKVKGVYHKNMKVSVAVQLPNSFKTIQIDTEIWCGTIVCEG